VLDQIANLLEQVRTVSIQRLETTLRQQLKSSSFFCSFGYATIYKNRQSSNPRDSSDCRTRGKTTDTKFDISLARTKKLEEIVSI